MPAKRRIAECTGPAGASIVFSGVCVLACWRVNGNVLLAAREAASFLCSRSVMPFGFMFSVHGQTETADLCDHCSLRLLQVILGLAAVAAFGPGCSCPRCCQLSLQLPLGFRECLLGAEVCAGPLCPGCAALTGGSSACVETPAAAIREWEHWLRTLQILSSTRFPSCLRQKITPPHPTPCQHYCMQDCNAAQEMDERLGLTRLVLGGFRYPRQSRTPALPLADGLVCCLGLF